MTTTTRTMTDARCRTRHHHPSSRHLARAMAGMLALIAAACARSGGAMPEPAMSDARADAPHLVVFITVDQLRGDMLSRYSSDMRRGYRRLMDGGAWFVNAFQDHAITETAPGHASTMSGRFPRSTGIMANSVGVVDTRYPLLAGLPNEAGASPERFRGTTLFDWVRASNRRARAFSVSAKDRGAILPIGRARENVYWYSNRGAFTTSTYYRDEMPDWVHAFNARRLPYRYAGGAWRLSRDPSTYPMPDSVVHENRGQNLTFPHMFPADTLRAAGALRASPMMDSIIALFALEGLRQLDIGRGPHTDIMAVSFSATDYVGHTWGPDSREAYENQIRLDQTIGWFLDSLYRLRDSSRIVVALTADHGVSPNPELARERGEATGEQGLRVSLRSLVNRFRGELHERGADSAALLYDGELVGLDRDAMRRARLDVDSVLDAFSRAALQVPGVYRVDRLSAVHQAARENPMADPFARRWSHQVPENSPVDLVITLTRYTLWGNIPATHGSPWDQDAHVPVIFYGAGIRPGRYSEFARVVDMAPTLAQVLGVTPLERLDGEPLRSALRQ